MMKESSARWLLLLVGALTIGGSSQSSLTATVGDDVTVRCGIDVSTSGVSWKHKNSETNQVRYIVSSPKFQINDADSSLTIHDVSVHDSGLYVCSEGSTGNRKDVTRLTVHWEESSDAGIPPTVAESTDSPPAVDTAGGESNDPSDERQQERVEVDNKYENMTITLTFPELSRIDYAKLRAMLIRALNKKPEQRRRPRRRRTTTAAAVADDRLTTAAELATTPDVTEAETDVAEETRTTLDQAAIDADAAAAGLTTSTGDDDTSTVADRSDAAGDEAPSTAAAVPVDELPAGNTADIFDVI